jgi:predicted nucleic acid-binding protein
MNWLILDTSVYIDLWERAKNTSALTELGRRYIVRHCSIVLSELRRGARSAEAIQATEDLRDGATEVWSPSPEHWWLAGQLIQRLGDQLHWDIRRRRDFQNDALIAFTAKHFGATVATSNRRDFELLSQETGVPVAYL